MFVYYMKPLIYTYVVILILEILYIKFYLDHWSDYKKHELDEAIQYNLDHKDELNKKFSDIVSERIKMLDTMDYFEWLDYNVKNRHVIVNGRQYHISIWERNTIDEYSRSDTADYTVRCASQSEFLNLSFKNVINLINYNFLYGVYKPSTDIPNNLWGLAGLYGHHTSIANIFWLNEDAQFPVERTMIFNKYKKENLIHDKEYGKIEFQGLLLIGYEIHDLDLDYGKVYYQFLGWWFFIFMTILFFVLSLVLHYASNMVDYMKPMLFLLITNSYLMYFLSFQAGLTSSKTEETKLVDINSGILAISFLVAVNIFIVKTLGGEKKNSSKWFLHTETAILFCISLCLLLISSIKKSNFFNIEELRVHNILIQFFFNLSILINLIIFLNYLIYIIGFSKYFKSLKIMR
jgi:hypothetical protein